MAILRKMVATVDLGPGGSQKYFFMSNPLLYAQIGTIVGIAEALSTDTQAIHRVEDLLLYGVLERFAVRTGTTPLNRKTAKILCATNKTVVAEQSLKGQTIPQGTITSVSADLKAQNYLG